MIAILVVTALLLAVASAWFLAQPLYRVTRRAPGPEREQWLALRDRLLTGLRELDMESADRNMDVDAVAEERQRLESELAQVLRKLETAESPLAGQADARDQSARRPWLMALISLGAGLPLLAGGLYYLNHSSTLQQFSGAAGGQPVPAMALERVARLEQRLAGQPEDSQGWARLGRAYAVMGRQDEARSAYQRAARQAPDDIEILSAYASFLVGLSPEDPPAEAVEVYERILKLDARNPGALWVLGIRAYNQARYSEALKLWERLLASLPAGNEFAPQVQRAVEAARERQRGAR